jgi:ABC-2 type transport system ATP-binding protein
MIKDGKIVASVATADIRHNRNKTYKIEFLQHDDLVKFLAESLVTSSVITIQKKDESCAQCTIGINDSDINSLTKILCSYKVRFFKEIKYSLEQYFNSIYRVESDDQ